MERSEMEHTIKLYGEAIVLMTKHLERLENKIKAIESREIKNRVRDSIVDIKFISSLVDDSSDSSSDEENIVIPVKKEKKSRKKPSSNS